MFLKLGLEVKNVKLNNNFYYEERGQILVNAIKKKPYITSL